LRAKNKSNNRLQLNSFRHTPFPKQTRQLFQDFLVFVEGKVELEKLSYAFTLDAVVDENGDRDFTTQTML
jgi:hypothetical protein